MFNTDEMISTNEGEHSKEIHSEEEGTQLRKEKENILLFKRHNIDKAIQNDDVDLNVIFSNMTN